MQIERDSIGDVQILQFAGELDAVDLPALAERMDRMIERGERRVVFDLQSLAFINSAALGYLVKISKGLGEAGGEMVIARPSRFVTKTLRTLGLDEVFKVFPSIEQATAHFPA